MTPGRARHGWQQSHEYFCQEEGHGLAPHPDGAPGRYRGGGAGRGTFSLGGHRLSSLYRESETGALTLTDGYGTRFRSSSWSKYSWRTRSAGRSAWMEDGI
ncbi:hypothetical protein EV655_103130 [Rhodovulum euryhalinum]|uniref:Uncharacterized protein n=1 Tax=Rhodovulum euryhalinum TaxID=35805 RepID=A0A4R2KGM4_9RHOB|nr:hypothetical protein EV655_103130 [Rhodovulum euryhalinum]